MTLALFDAHAHIGSEVDMVTMSGHYMEIPMEVLGEWVPVDSDSRDNILGGFQHEYEGRL